MLILFQFVSLGYNYFSDNFILNLHLDKFILLDLKNTMEKNAAFSGNRIMKICVISKNRAGGC